MQIFRVQAEVAVASLRGPDSIASLTTTKPHDITPTWPTLNNADQLQGSSHHLLGLLGYPSGDLWMSEMLAEEIQPFLPFSAWAILSSLVKTLKPLRRLKSLRRESPSLLPWSPCPTCLVMQLPSTLVHVERQGQEGVSNICKPDPPHALCLRGNVTACTHDILLANGNENMLSCFHWPTHIFSALALDL